MWLSEQLLKSQAVLGNLEQAPRRGLLEGFSQFVNDFIKASRNVILDILHKKQPIIGKTISGH
jgi:hypothetical protein